MANRLFSLQNLTLGDGNCTRESLIGRYTHSHVREHTHTLGITNAKGLIVYKNTTSKQYISFVSKLFRETWVLTHPSYVPLSGKIRDVAFNQEIQYNNGTQGIQEEHEHEFLVSFASKVNRCPSRYSLEVRSVNLYMCSPLNCGSLNMTAMLVRCIPYGPSPPQNDEPRKLEGRHGVYHLLRG